MALWCRRACAPWSRADRRTPCAQRIPIPGVDARTADQGCREALARSGTAAFLRGAAEPRRADVAHRLRHRRRHLGRGALRKISTFNDRVQALLFDPNRLAQTYPESAITRPFRSTPIIPRATSPRSTARITSSKSTAWSRTRKPGRSNELYALPQETQITRHICVEGWSAIGKWTGVRLSDFLRRVGADLPPNMSGSAAPRAIQLDRHGDSAASADPDDAANSTARSCRPNTASP